MRYPADHKAESRGRILKAAAQQVRAKGPHKIAVAEVMSAAGLTHGAFYAHFESKDGLVAEAVTVMFHDADGRGGGLGGMSALEGGQLAAALRAYLEGYLSPSHRDRPDRGCPLPALAADIARTNDLSRHNFVAGLNNMMGHIGAALARQGRARPEADARAVVAQMVGALGLARAVGANAQSDEILRDCLRAIVERLDL